MNSREIVLWLDERWYQALTRQLEVEKLEDKLNEYLDDLIRQLPAPVYDTIMEELREEQQRQKQEQEASQKYSAFRVTENGVTEHFRVEQAVRMLDSASYVRRWLRQTERCPFREMLSGRENISAEEYDQMAAGRVGEDRKITGVYDVDLDAREFSAVRPDHGWITYRLKDVSTASWHSYRTGSYDRERREARFMEKLKEKDIPSAGHLSAENITFMDEISETSGLLNFRLETAFDVDAVFGTHICTAGNDDTLNAYANYDMTAGQLCGELEIAIHHNNVWTESLVYTLNAAEKSILLKKMDAYCQQQTGQSLADYSAQRLAEDITPPAGPVM